MIFHRSALTAIRELRHLRKADIVNATDLSPSYVTELESNSKNAPSLEVIRKLAEALEVDPEALYVSTAAVRSWVQRNEDIAIEWLIEKLSGEELASRVSLARQADRAKAVAS